MILRNTLDKEINFNNLEKAKSYYSLSDDKIREKLANKENDDYYVNCLTTRNNEVKNAANLRELADALNLYSDVVDNGSEWYVIEEKYEIKKKCAEIPYKERNNIVQGITFGNEWGEDELIESFDSIEDARKKLDEYDTSIREMSGNAGTYYLVEEYYIEYNEYCDDKVINSGDVYDYSKMVIEVNKKPGYETVATYDNWEDAEKKMQELQYNDEENNEYYIK